MIQKLLATAKPFGYEEWNTKSLILYGRSHGYTISCNYGIFKKNLQMKKLLTKYKMPEGNVIQAKRAELDMPINVTDSDNGKQLFICLMKEMQPQTYVSSSSKCTTDEGQ